MAAPSPLSGSQVAASGRGSDTSLCDQGTWSSLKVHARSFPFSFAPPSAVLAAGNSTTGDRPAQITATTSAVSLAGARAPTTPVVAIIVGAVGGAVALVALLALVYVLRVRRKVERFRRSTNVLGSELTPTVSRTSDVTSVGVAVSRVTPGARVQLANGTRLASVTMPGHQRDPHHSSTPAVTSLILIGPLRSLPPPPTRKLAIGIGVSHAIRHTPRPSAGPQTPARSPYEVVLPLQAPPPSRDARPTPPQRSLRSNVDSV